MDTLFCSTKGSFFGVRLRMDVPTKGGQEQFHRKLFTGKRPFPGFSREKVPFRLLEKKPQTPAQHLISRPLRAR